MSSGTTLALKLPIIWFWIRLGPGMTCGSQSLMIAVPTGTKRETFQHRSLRAIPSIRDLYLYWRRRVTVITLLLFSRKGRGTGGGRLCPGDATYLELVFKRREIMMILTREIVEKGKSSRGGWSHKQRRVLGVDFTEGRKWYERIIGKSYDAKVVEEFLSLKNAHLLTGTSTARDVSNIMTAYVDGATVGPNPSSVGGAWAYVLLDGLERVVAGSSSCVVPADVRLPRVTNNMVEMLAAVNALENLPVGWDGVLRTDSYVTLCRLHKVKRKCQGFPDWLRVRLDVAKSRVGLFIVELVAGHPTAEQLDLGCDEKGVPVSRWNVWCDDECGRVIRERFPRQFR